jgi:hypothetical protein
MPVNESGGNVSSWSILLRGIFAAVRQEIHLSPCPNFPGRLYFTLRCTGCSGIRLRHKVHATIVGSLDDMLQLVRNAAASKASHSTVSQCINKYTIITILSYFLHDVFI